MRLHAVHRSQRRLRRRPSRLRLRKPPPAVPGPSVASVVQAAAAARVPKAPHKAVHASAFASDITDDDAPLAATPTKEPPGPPTHVVPAPVTLSPLSPPSAMTLSLPSSVGGAAEAGLAGTASSQTHPVFYRKFMAALRSRTLPVPLHEQVVFTTASFQLHAPQFDKIAILSFSLRAHCAFRLDGQYCFQGHCQDVTAQL